MREYRLVSKAAVLLQAHFRAREARKRQALYARLRSALSSTRTWGCFLVDYCTLLDLLTQRLKPSSLDKKEHKNLSEPVR